MEKYLIIRCTDLYDQNECDADRRSLILVDDWEKWVSAHPKEHYEIYKVGFAGRLYRIYDTYYSQ
jgi:hypothetical protein